MMHPGSGTGQFCANALKVIRLHRHGCTNRPFFHIVVSEKKRLPFYDPVIEQLGTYDPMPNEFNEKLVSLNIERIKYWLGNGADISKPAAQLLGIAGLLPIHPVTYMRAWRIRAAAAKEAEEKAKIDESNKETETG